MMDQFTKDYYRLLTEDYVGINLTRIIDFEEFRNKQIEDSIISYKKSTRFKMDLDKCQLMVDVGFGGGFPILPMAKLLPNYKFFGIETRNKKVITVGKIAEELGLKNIHLIHSRVENILFDINTVVTFKAVGKVWDFLSKLSTTKKIQVYFYKGPNFYELEKDQIEIAKKSWNIIEETEFIVPGTDKRYLIGFENKERIISANNVNQLVKLSTFN